MLKNFNPIIIVAGEPKSIFLELYIKNFDKFKKSPLILIASQKLLLNQMKLLKLKKKINILSLKRSINFNNLNNKKINLIDIPLDYKNLDTIKIKNSNKYINNSFEVALELLKKIKIYV